MKTTVFFLTFMIFSQIVICQNKSIKIEQLFITNKLTTKSVKLFTSEETLKTFGNLLKTETLDQTIHSEDYAKKYIFDDIIFYVSTQGRISSFETDSKNIMIEKKGLFNVSPGSGLAEITSVFPEEINNAVLLKYGLNNEQYICVKINLSDFSKNIHAFVDIDYSLNLLYDPNSKILKCIYIWVRP
jgi:hypothetical protein